MFVGFFFYFFFPFHYILIIYLYLNFQFLFIYFFSSCLFDSLSSSNKDFIFLDSPKEIFKCSWPGCPRSFVREDLRKRHFKRHRENEDLEPEQDNRESKNLAKRSRKTRSQIVSDPEVLHEEIYENVRQIKQEEVGPVGNVGILDHKSDTLLSTLVSTSNEDTRSDIITAHNFTKMDNSLDENEMKKLPDTILLNEPNTISSGATEMADVTIPQESALIPDTMGSATEIISWLFSDAMLANVRDPLLSPTYHTFDSPMALQNLLTPPVINEELGISQAKRNQMLDLIPGLKADLASHNIAEDVPFQQKYMAVFWSSFHPQFPILHKPTFNPDKCPSGLLWSIILVGAALRKEDTLARCIAEPLRWAIFGSLDFNPPAKLWVIQALLILEMYEKTQGDRQMHVRAHIHHGTTLQLIRRGTILTGGSNDSMIPRITGDGDDYLSANKGDPWKRWIQTESTKRAALMAFVIDAYHSVIFGHPSLIAIHEIRLALPCSQYLWDSFPSENQPMIPQRATLPLIEALKLTLNNKHVETSPFGRKVLLSGLMSIDLQMQQRGLQLESLDWCNHGNNGGLTNGHNHTSWKGHLCSSFDFWMNDYRKMLSQSNAASFDHYPPLSLSSALSSESCDRNDRLSPFDSVSTPSSAVTSVGLGISYNRLSVSGCADPFYHLAHMNLQEIYLDLHIYAGAPVMHSRSFRTVDFERAYRSIKTWAYNPQSITAVRHAVLFLEEMFCPKPATDCCPNPFSSCSVVPGEYSAATDPLLHRPRAVFLSALLIWTYGFVLDGPESTELLVDNSGFNHTNSGSVYYLGTPNEPMDPNKLAGEQRNNPASVATKIFDKISITPPAKRSGIEYITWLSKALASSSPRSKMAILEGRNETVGLLRMVIRSLQGSHWVLIQEDERLLVHCLERTLGKQSQKCMYHI